jgi:cellulose synthase/poly-beta-1,6-N-acetylglucosamine synthase-like glycosyltransferase
MTGPAVDVLLALDVVVILYFLVLNTSYFATTALALVALRRQARRAEAVVAEDVLTAGAPPITLIAPAYNEAASCVEATNALLSLIYPEYEVLVVNDGSRDDTLARLVAAFELEPVPRAPTAEIPTARVREVYRSRRRPNLWVVDKENGGKADALNVGVNYCRTELFCALDADTLLERDALGRLVRPFLEDARTVAAGGMIRIVNDSLVRVGVVSAVRLPRKLLARFQVLEYLRAFLAGRVGWDVLDAVLIISGAFGLFRRGLVAELGGFAQDTVGEDMELVVRMHRHCRERRIPYRITFVSDPVAWTECPERLRDLGRQRDRWQRGLMQVLWRHRRMLFNPRYGRVGMVAFPYFFFLEGLGPVIELLGYAAFLVSLALGRWYPLYALALFMVAFVFGAALSVAAVGLEELSFRRYERWRDLARLLALSVLETFGYRQLNSWWRVRGIISALRREHAWGAMTRRGFQSAGTT